MQKSQNVDLRVALQFTGSQKSSDLSSITWVGEEGRFHELELSPNLTFPDTNAHLSMLA